MAFQLCQDLPVLNFVVVDNLIYLLSSLIFCDLELQIEHLNKYVTLCETSILGIRISQLYYVYIYGTVAFNICRNRHLTGVSLSGIRICQMCAYLTQVYAKLVHTHNWCLACLIQMYAKCVHTHNWCFRH